MQTGCTYISRANLQNLTGTGHHLLPIPTTFLAWGLRRRLVSGGDDDSPTYISRTLRLLVTDSPPSAGPHTLTGRRDALA